MTGRHCNASSSSTALKDMTGLRFGRLLVLSRSPNKGRAVSWECECDCGMKKSVLGKSLRFGLTVSCGCYLREASGARSYRHGQSRTKEYMSEYRKNRKSTDPIFNLTCRIRKLIRQALKIRQIERSAKTVVILGCSFADFRIHIENQFTAGMCWERISEIHIDHKIPLASARSAEDVIRLNHFSNLQPLWAIDNLKKGSKIIGSNL